MLLIDHNKKTLTVYSDNMPNLTDEELRTISNYKLFGYELKVNDTQTRKPGRPRKNPDVVIAACSVSDSSPEIKPVRERKHSPEYWAAKAAERQNSPYTKESVSKFFAEHSGGDYDKAKELYTAKAAEPSKHTNKDGSTKPKGHAVALRFVKTQFPDIYKEMDNTTN